MVTFNYLRLGIWDGNIVVTAQFAILSFNHLAVIIAFAANAVARVFCRILIMLGFNHQTPVVCEVLPYKVITATAPLNDVITASV